MSPNCRVSAFNFSLMAIGSTLVAFSLLYGDLAHAGPNGPYGSNYSWTQQETDEFNLCYQKQGQNLESGPSPSDGAKYCSTNDKKSLYLDLFISVSRYESNWDPTLDTGTNKGRTPVGLFQMDAEDMKEHKCAAAGYSDPYDSKQNICCAIMIADQQAAKGHTALSETEQSDARSSEHVGILDAFWQTMRDGTGGDGKGGTVDNTATHDKVTKLAQQVCQAGPENYASNGNSQQFALSSGTATTPGYGGIK